VNDRVAVEVMGWHFVAPASGMPGVWRDAEGRSQWAGDGYCPTTDIELAHEAFEHALAVNRVVWTIQDPHGDRCLAAWVGGRPALYADTLPKLLCLMALEIVTRSQTDEA